MLLIYTIRMRKHKKIFQPTSHRLCNGKVCYDHKIDAENVQKEQELLTRDLILAVYRCSHCTKWHLTRKING
jgi:hypothetical protein